MRPATALDKKAQEKASRRQAARELAHVSTRLLQRRASDSRVLAPLKPMDANFAPAVAPVLERSSGGNKPPTTVGRTRGASLGEQECTYAPEAAAATQPASPALLWHYGESLPKVVLPHAPLFLPEVELEPEPEQTTAVNSGAVEFPDVLVLESWLNSMLDRAVVSKKTELESKIMDGVSLPHYHDDQDHHHPHVTEMWRGHSDDAMPPLSVVGCSREQLYRYGGNGAAVERTYRALYSYAVGLPLAIAQISADMTAGEHRVQETQQVAVRLLGLFVTLQHETIKCVHGNDTAAQVEEVLVAGVYSRLRTGAFPYNP